MLGNPLIKFLQSFSKREMTRFKDYVYSPYFNKREDVQRLITYLHGIFPQFDMRNCERKQVYQQVFDEEPYHQATLALVFTYTNRLLYEFLAQEQFDSDNALQQLLMLQNLRQRKQNERYEKALKQTRRDFQAAPDRGNSYYFRSFQLASEADLYYSLTNTRGAERSLQSKQAALDHFYLSEQLKDACERQVRRRIENTPFTTPLFEALLKEVSQSLSTYAGVPPVVVYYQVYRVWVESSFNQYEQALACLQQYRQLLPLEELKTIYNLLQNFCIGQINRGDERFLQAVFELYQAQLDQGLLLEEGYLSEWHYKNVVTAGLRLREMEWVRQFIEQYRDMMPPETSSNAYRFNLASYYYATKDYGKVLDLLIHVEYNDLRYILGSKALLLRTYYDLGEHEALRSLAASFRLYLQRHKLMADFRRQGYHNLFRFTRRAAQIRANQPFQSNDKTKRDIAKLHQDIMTADTIFNKGWLLEKLGEL